MSKQETVELKLDRRLYDTVHATLEKKPWMGFTSVEEFIIDALKRHVERLWHLVPKREAGEK